MKNESVNMQTNLISAVITDSIIFTNNSRTKEETATFSAEDFLACLRPPQVVAEYSLLP
jgi:hypothetical protein